MELKEQLYEIGKDLQLANLATITSEGKPWGRYVMGYMNEALQFRFPTHAATRKAEQISNNENVHITLGVSDIMNAKSWIQIEGKAEISHCKDEKKRFWNPNLANIFTDETDPNYTVVIVNPTKIELVSAGEPTPVVLHF